MLQLLIINYLRLRLTIKKINSWNFFIVWHFSFLCNVLMWFDKGGSEITKKLQAKTVPQSLPFFQLPTDAQHLKLSQ